MSMPQSTSNPSLPYDLLLSCLARVSRLYYPTLSLVSKSFRSILASPELYKVRSLLGRTESCFYVCLRHNTDFHWFTLCRKPDNTQHVLLKLPIPLSHVTVGSNKHKIDGSCDYMSLPAAPKFLILDCTSNTWREGTSLPVGLTSLATCVIYRKIHDEVCHPLLSLNNNSLEKTTQIWDPEADPFPCRRGIDLFVNRNCVCVDGQFYENTWREGFTYNHMEGRWKVVEQGTGVDLSPKTYCEIGNVLYSVWHGMFTWYDTEVSIWRCLHGLEQLQRWQFVCVRLADYGGKLAVFFNDNITFRDNGNTKRYVWCAVIGLEKRKNCEIWGNVEWLDGVLQVPDNCDLVKVFSVTV